MSLDRDSWLASPRFLWLAFAATLMLSVAFPWLSGMWDLTLLDSISSPAEARELLAGMTATQKAAHAWITATADVAYPLAYASFFAGSALCFFPNWGARIAAIELSSIPVDLLEGLVQVLALTGTADALSSKAFLTPLKMVLFIGGMLFTLAAYVTWWRRRDPAERG